MSSSSELGRLSAEIERLRSREREWFTVAEGALARERRALEFARSLARLSRSSTLETRGLRPALLEILRAAASAVEATRVGMWIFGESKRVLECLVLIDLASGREETGQRIDAAAYPAYFAALDDERVIAAGDARSDPRTRELGSSYLEPFGLAALLDAPVRVFGRTVGVVCHEFASPREFSPEVQTFAATIADFAALALERRQRREAESIATTSEAKYRHLVEALPAVVYSFEPRGLALDYVSPQITALTGEDPQTYLERGRPWWDRIHPEEREAAERRVAEAVRSGTPLSLEYRLVGSDGTVRWVHDSFRVVRDESGAPLAIQGLLEDVTAAKAEALERAEYERRFRSLLESVQAIAVLLDRDGRITFVNDWFLEIVRRKREDVIGGDWFELMLPLEDRERTRAIFLESTRRGDIVTRFENQIVTADGDQRLIVWSNTILREASGRMVGTASLGVDVTERVRLQEEMLLAQKQESLGRMAAGIAHDFNNLLTVILGGVESALTSVSVLDASRADLERALLAASRARDLTGSLLTYARKRKLDARVFEVDPLVRESLRILRSLVGTTIALEAAFDADGARVRADPALLQQVLINLGVNARDALGTHGHVRVRTELALLDGSRSPGRVRLAAGPYVAISVADDGAGIDPSVLPRIFDPFFTTKREGFGVGLGLSSALGFVQQAGGDIAVESQPGRGTTFRVFLPRSAGERSVGDVPGEVRVEPRGGEHVLLVEDQELVRRFIASSLAQFGYRVSAARSFDEALALARGSPDAIDVVVTDLDLPGGSGIELVRRLGAILSNARVLVISGFGDVAERTTEIAGVDVLPKPFTPLELASRIRTLLAR